jgi:regulation of enolase protein 1 (concanavalin A-like superfamily)
MVSSQRAILMGVVFASVLTPLTEFTQAAGPVSDDFNACDLNRGVWTPVNPLGTATLTLEGLGTEDARAVISIPDGPPHDVWTTYNDTVRLLQPAENKDFEVRVKFDSLLTTGYQMQGVLVEQDVGRFLRYDLIHDGTSPFLFSATFASGAAVIRGNRAIANAAPLHLSVLRAGDQWTLRYSYDGATWLDFSAFSFAMAVGRVGPFAGNWSMDNPPATTVNLDYFLNVASPLSREDGPADTNLTLTTAATGQGSIAVDPLKSSYACGEQVTVTAIPAPGWKFDLWSGDLSGTTPTQTLSMVVARVIHARFVADGPSALQITNLLVTPSQTGAVITWNTNQPASSRLRYGTTSSYELGELLNEAFVISHSVSVTGLAANTQHHYSITCVDQSNRSTITPDATFTTTNAPPPADLTSDDFSGGALNTQLWTIGNPSGQATFRTVGTGTADARLEITVPAGVPHGAGPDGVQAPWVKQQVQNKDFGVQAKFDSVIDKSYQIQGLIIQEDNDTYLRCDFYADNATPHLYVAAFDDGTTRTLANVTVPGGVPYFLRVSREGDLFTVSYSKNGQSWTQAASFAQPMTVTAVGPYVANEGSPAPAFTGLVDYVFNTANPIVAEDGQQNQDTTPPTISSIQAVPQETSIGVSWTTDEPANSVVLYGRTAAYELGSNSDLTPSSTHAISITGLDPNTDYNLRISSADASGNEAQSDNLVVRTAGIPTGGPTVDIWYGDTQEFGRIGTPVPMINVLGNASTDNGLSSLSYSLNGGSLQALSVGPNTRRLALAGDFNVEIPFSQLQPGSNNVQIRARDQSGRETIRTVSVINSSGPVWPNPYFINWGGVSDINSVAQVIDGIWGISGGSVRPLVLAYDRLIAVGDRTWQNYEASCPITVHSIDTAGYAAPSYGPGVGVLLRWPGHTNDGHQPWEGVYPLGAIGFFRWTSAYERFEIFGNNGRILASAPDETLQLGVQYTFKMRVQSFGDQAQYQFKWWTANQTEPSDWQLTGSQSLNEDPGSGCILLLAHHVDASFGNVTVVPAP